MNGELFPAASPFPATREDALAALEAFVPRAGVYAKRRNHVVAGHPHVSRLSAALRCRLIREEEVRGAVAERFAPSTVEKFVQEVWWRLYWKGALEMRPGQWSDYRHALAAVPEEQRERAARIEAGESGVAIMDHFARELVETGYLHNHTRMWYAGFWVHTERLPWELGADFFLRHLLDGDAASNTLSWRWVAGLQTPGKTYLARRSNIEKYVDPDLLEGRTEGLERLERGSPNPEYADAPPRERAGPFPDSPARWSSRGQRWGWWLHDEDLSAETGELFEGSPAAVVAPFSTGLWDRLGWSASRRDYLRTALEDGATRFGDAWGVSVEQPDSGELAATLAEWARRNRLETVVAMRPFVGPLLDEIDGIRESLRRDGVELVLLRRDGDAEIMRKATAGFFGFWKKAGPGRG